MNKPVAWMRLTGDRVTRITLEKVQDSDIPLYTHPVKEYTPNQTLECSFDLAGFKQPVKELTDEEIKSEAMYFCHSYHTENPERLVLFARAILRKAQEK